MYLTEFTEHIASGAPLAKVDKKTRQKPSTYYPGEIDLVLKTYTPHPGAGIGKRLRRVLNAKGLRIVWPPLTS
jgi:hypothetical protein